MPVSPEQRLLRVKEAPPMSLAERFQQRIATMGIGPLNGRQVRQRYRSLSGQLDIGLNRTGEPKTKDRGLLALPTHLKPVRPEQVEEKTKVGDKVVVGEFGGEGMRFSVATMGPSGVIEREELKPLTLEPGQRQMRVTDLTDILADQVDRAMSAAGSHDIDFGFSFGLPATIQETPDGLDATIITPKGDGDVGIKEWVFPDFPKLTDQEKKIVAAVRRKLGIPGKGTIANDTAVVETDTNKIREAEEADLRVLPIGVVGGTGLNGTLAKNDELINTEIGHARWPDDEISQRVRKRLKDSLLAQGKIYNAQDRPEPEHETGANIVRRVAAAVDILGDEPNGLNRTLATQLADDIELKGGPNGVKGFVDKLAIGEITLTENSDINGLIQILTQNAMSRAAQVYGIILASLAKPVLAENNGTHGPVIDERDAAILTEGSMLLKGLKDESTSIRVLSEIIATRLVEQRLTLVGASGLDGMAATIFSRR